MRLTVMKRLARKWSSAAAILFAVVGGVWAFYLWYLAGASDWMVNLDMTTQILPYTADQRLLVVHVKSKNPTAKEVEFLKPNATFTLTVREVCKAGSVQGAWLPDRCPELVPKLDLMPDGGYDFMPGAEFDDTRAIVIKADSLVYLGAELTRREGRRQPLDYVAVDRFVKVSDR